MRKLYVDDRQLFLIGCEGKRFSFAYLRGMRITVVIVEGHVCENSKMNSFIVHEFFCNLCDVLPLSFITVKLPNRFKMSANI